MNIPQSVYYRRPIKNKTRRMRSTRPTPALGKYPQERLCGQRGMLPISAMTSTIVRIMNMSGALLAARDMADVASGDGECT